MEHPELPATPSGGGSATSGVYATGNALPQQSYDVAISEAPIELSLVTRTDVPVYEVWTERTVYALDVTLRCTAVREISSGQCAAEHPALGAQLLVGELATEDRVDISSPLPAVGHRAVFSRADQGVTISSPVTRVVLNLYRCTRARRRRSWQKRPRIRTLAALGGVDYRSRPSLR